MPAGSTEKQLRLCSPADPPHFEERFGVDLLIFEVQLYQQSLVWCEEASAETTENKDWCGGAGSRWSVYSVTYQQRTQPCTGTKIARK